MANLGPVSGRSTGGRLGPPLGQVIARYATYGEAQRAVDFLSDNRFPVQAVTIVGTGLRTVERVTGRLTYGRVALAGALSGAWFGLFVGLLLSLFADGPEAGVMAAVLIGAGFGMLFGVISYAATRGRRDFTSRSAIVASEYQVLCQDEQARAAIEVLGRLPHAGPGVPAPPDPARFPGYDGPPGPPQAPPPPDPYRRPEPQDVGPVDPYAPRPTGPVTTGAGPDAAVPPGGPAAPGAAGPGDDATTERPTPSGPTYGEVMEQRRREQREREAAERAARLERDQAAAEAEERDRA